MTPVLIFGSDHRGYNMKHILQQEFSEDHSVLDCGTHTGEDSVDYPLFAHSVTSQLTWVKETDGWAEGRQAFGVLICGSGFGVAIAANKTPGIRAVTCRSVQDAVMARKHNDANVVCIGADITALSLANQIVTAFTETEFEGGRHQKRVDLIDKGVMPELL